MKKKFDKVVNVEQLIKELIGAGAVSNKISISTDGKTYTEVECSIDPSSTVNAHTPIKELTPKQKYAKLQSDTEKVKFLAERSGLI